MSSKLENLIIIGNPNSGKSTFLDNFSNSEKSSRFYWKKYKDNSFLSFQNRVKKGMLDNVNSFDKFVADEPFFIIPILENLELFYSVMSRNYCVATHKLSYWLLSSPNIILMSDFNHRNVSYEELCGLISKPSYEFYSKDIVNFSDFLNSFDDVSIPDNQVNGILTNPVLKEMRTTPFIRDALIYVACNGNLDCYLKDLKKFFESKLEYVSDNKIKDIILGQLHPLITNSH